MPDVHRAYAYDGDRGAVSLPHSITERGPPATAPTYSTETPVDTWSLGSLARPSVASRVVTYDNDDLSRLVQTNSIFQEPVEEAAPGAGPHSSLSPSGVAAKSADDWPVISGIVRDASRSKGNFGLGSGTASQATRAGESWVGDGYRIASDGKTLVSRDGLRVFRPPSWKPNLGKYQANFEYWVEGQVTRKPIGNGHFDVTDMVP